MRLAHPVDSSEVARLRMNYLLKDIDDSLMSTYQVKKEWCYFFSRLAENNKLLNEKGDKHMHQWLISITK